MWQRKGRDYDHANSSVVTGPPVSSGWHTEKRYKLAAIVGGALVIALGVAVPLLPGGGSGQNIGSSSRATSVARISGDVIKRAVRTCETAILAREPILTRYRLTWVNLSNFPPDHNEKAADFQIYDMYDTPAKPRDFKSP